MSELLIRVSSNARHDPDDVIYIAPDGHEWSKAEKNSKNFKIIKGVNLTQTDKELLLSPDRQYHGNSKALKNLSFAKIVNRDEIYLKDVRRKKYKYTDKIERK